MISERGTVPFSSPSTGKLGQSPIILLARFFHCGLLDRPWAKLYNSSEQTRFHGGLAMLVLSRKQSERIRVGRDIVVTVVRVAGDKVRLGIEAPPDVVVLRDELQPFAPLAVSCIPAQSAANSN